jgi:hypothetical protein
MNKKILIRMYTKKYDYKNQHIKNLQYKKELPIKNKNISVFDKLKSIKM